MPARLIIIILVTVFIRLVEPDSRNTQSARRVWGHDHTAAIYLWQNKFGMAMSPDPFQRRGLVKGLAMPD